MSKIEGMKFFEGFRLAKTVGRHLKDRSNYTPEEFIEIAEISIRKFPDDWITLYALGNKYPDVGRYYDSIKILEKCVEIKPKLLISMFGKNIYQYPIDAINCLQIIASNDPDIVFTITDWELMLGRSISRIACIWKNYLFQDINAFVKALGLSKKGRFLYL